MGGELSRKTPMELRRQDRVRAESYNVLLESGMSLHSQRALRRELCITRVAIIILLLLVSTSFIFLYFIHQSPAHKDKGHNGKANGEMPKEIQALVDSEEPKPKKHNSAALTIAACTDTTSPGNITWEIKRQLVGFNLTEYGKSLIVPEEGTYRISIQVTYRGSCDQDSIPNQTQPSNQIQLWHYVKVYSHGYEVPRTFLEAYETVYCEHDYWMKSMYSEEVFLLQKGDRLMVETNQLNLLNCEGNRGAMTFLTAQSVDDEGL